MTTASERSRYGLIFIILGLLIIAAFGIRTISQSEVWMHLATGRVIAEHGVPEKDLLTFSKAGEAWIAGSWMYDRLVYALWNIGGASGTILFHLALVIATFLLLIPVARKWANGMAIGFACLLSAWLFAPSFSPQPLFVGFFFAGLFIFLLERELPLWKLAVVLVSVQLIWTNMHESFLVGPMLCALYAIQKAVASRNRKEKGTAQLGGLALGLLAATLVNPYGLALHRMVWASLLDPSRLYVQQWISPFSNLFLPSTTKHFITIALAVGAGGLITQRQKLPVALTTLAVISAFLAVRSMLSVAVLAVLAFPFFCLSLQSIGEAMGSILEKAVKIPRSSVARLSATLLTILAILSLFLITSNRYYTREGSASAFGMGVQEELFPSAALDLMQKEYFPERVVNALHDGGFLAWSMPQRRIFIDTRYSLFGAPFYQMVINGVLRGDPESWMRILDEWQPGAVVVNASESHAGTATQNLLLGGGWSLVYFDGTSAVFMQPLSHYTDLIANMETQAAGLKVLDETYRDYLARLGGWTRPAISPRLLGAANVFLALSRYEEAAALFSALTRGAPAMAGAWLNLGICQLQQGKTDSAITSLERASEMLPRRALCWLWLSRAYTQSGRTEEAGYAYERASRLDSSMASAFGNPLSGEEE